MDLKLISASQTPQARLRAAERRLTDALGIQTEESWVDLPASGVRLRVLSVGEGPEIIALHGVSLTATAWLPLVAKLPGYRLRLIDLPGHGLSGRYEFAVGKVRAQATALMEQLFDALAAEAPIVLGHSLGGMLGLWHALARPDRISRLVLIGDPAVALPGVRVKMPLSLMTVPVLGPLVLASPAPRPLFKSLVGRGLGGRAAESMPPDLLDVLRTAPRQPGNPRTVASLMHALCRPTRPRPGKCPRRRCSQLSPPRRSSSGDVKTRSSPLWMDVPRSKRCRTRNWSKATAATPRGWRMRPAAQRRSCVSSAPDGGPVCRPLGARDGWTRLFT